MTAISSLKNYLIAAALVLFGTLVLSTVIPQAVSAQNYTPKKDLCGGADLKLDKADCPTGKNDPTNSLNDLIGTIVNVLSVAVGIVAVILIIWGGFKFVASGGDSGQIASARSTVLYAVVGLLIVAFSQVIVRFVLNKASAQ